jgi:hypothetical protein
MPALKRWHEAGDDEIVCASLNHEYSWSLFSDSICIASASGLCAIVSFIYLGANAPL